MLRLVVRQIDDIVVVVIDFVRLGHSSELDGSRCSIGSCLVSSYLFVTFLGCGSFLEVQASEDGVLAETLFDFQLCLLHSAFFIKLGLLFLPLFLQGLVVGEEIAYDALCQAWLALPAAVSPGPRSP